MKRNYIIIFTATLLLVCQVAFAGNPDRIGTAGATQLTINPWIRSSGWANAGMAGVSGVEAMGLNPSGPIGMKTNSQFVFSRASYLGGLGANINSFGFAIKTGSAKANALTLTGTSFDFGDVQMTTEALPEGGAGYYSINMLNLALGLSHKFSDNINAGFAIRAFSEGVSNVKAQGMAFDAGIQYKAGLYDRVKFGVALRNVGPSISFKGDGLTVRGTPQDVDYTQTLSKNTTSSELPSQLMIAGSYDIMADTASDHRLTFGASFSSNAFDNDLFNGGLEYSFMNMVMLRAGYSYKKAVVPNAMAAALVGPTAGVSFELPFGKARDRAFGIDYSYRTDPFGGTHTFGARLAL